MEDITFGEWVALYAALLSTALAISGFARWLLSGPRLSVSVFNPMETDFSRDNVFLAVISNCGSISTVVRKLEVSFRTSRWIWGKEIGKATFDERSHWKPAVKLVATDKPNTSRPEPNILSPGTELRAPARAITDYDPKTHWIKVTAYARNKRTGFTGWAGPSLPEQEKDQ